MTPYIVNLTDHLIGTLFIDVKLRARFYKQPEAIGIIKTELLYGGGMSKMTPETLGKIIGSLEKGDVRIFEESKRDSKFQDVHAHSDYDWTHHLRDLAATCLAYAIHHRLTPPYDGTAPQFERRRSK